MGDWLAFANQEVHQQDRAQYDQEVNRALTLQWMIGAPDPSEGRAAPQVKEDAKARGEWLASRSMVSAPQEVKPEVIEEKKDHPLLALKHGKSEMAQKVIDLAIEFGCKSAGELETNFWWGDFKAAGVTEDKWDAIKAELGC